MNRIVANIKIKSGHISKTDIKKEELENNSPNFI